MIMIRIFFSILIICKCIFSIKLMDLPQVMSEPLIKISGKYIYIFENKTIHFYSLKDLIYIKQIGKE